jgi:hypothetical protein
MMYSESDTLSPDGSLLAGAKDNSIFAQSQSGTEYGFGTQTNWYTSVSGLQARFRHPAGNRGLCSVREVSRSETALNLSH